MSRHCSLKILREICSIPTAPFHEKMVADWICAFVAAHPRLRISQDAAGNRLVLLPGRRPTPGLPRWVFAAHLDHPGFVAERMLGPRLLAAKFFGAVLARFARGEKVRFFHGGKETRGVIAKVEANPQTGYLTAAQIKVATVVPSDAIGMWDQGVGRFQGKRFLTRACDDLAGVAAALSMLDELHRNPPEAPVAVLLTRAEEAGFVGALAAVLKPQLLRRTDRLIAIETSAAQPFAPLGGGPVIRLGDKVSIFNSSLSYFLCKQAEALTKADRRFRFQRTVMPGGTCESTVYDAFGYHAAAACLALGNYHNMDRPRRRLGPEYIDVDDYLGLVRLFVAIARNGHTYRPGHHDLKAQLRQRFNARKHLLKLGGMGKGRKCPDDM